VIKKITCISYLFHINEPALFDEKLAAYHLSILMICVDIRLKTISIIYRDVMYYNNIRLTIVA